VLCKIGLPFQAAPEAKVAIIPRAAPPAEANPTDDPRTHLRVDVSMVLIPVHVATPLGTPVATLNRENFHLFEEGVEQQITYFAKDDAPVSVGIVFDSSGSMRNKMRKAAEAAAMFFKTANAEDEFFLVEFNDRPKLAVPFTSDSAELYQRIAHTRTFGRTSLLDAIDLALRQMKTAKNSRKAIVILSDGGDNRSRHTVRQIKNAVLESDVLIYAIGIFDSDDSPKRPIEEQNGPLLLDELTEQSGGRHYRAQDLEDLPDIGARIGNELRNQYLLGYPTQSAVRDGKYRRVKVNLSAPADMPKLKMYYRQGYYAPAQ
jgi:VWFA-related protein